jgi:hypothetical protein
MVLPVLGLLVVGLSRVAAQPSWLIGLLCLASMYLPGFAGEVRPMLSETREHAFLEPERRAVLDYIRREYDGTAVLVDIEKSAPLVYDTGIHLRNVLHGEGRATRWKRALNAPHAEAGWIWMMRDDMMWRRLQVDPHWADGYALALQTESFRVYRRRPAGRSDPLPAGRPE